MNTDTDAQVPRPLLSLVVATVDGGTVRVGASLSQRRHRSNEDDTKTHELVLYEFDDNELLSNFESLVVQCCPRDCLVEDLSNAKDGVKKRLARKIHNVLEALNVQVSLCKKTDFAPQDLEQDLRALTGEESLSRFKNELDMTQALRAAACLIKTRLMPQAVDAQVGDGSIDNDADQGLVHGGLGFRAGSLTQYMKLDSAAVSSLNLFPAVGDTNKESSVHGVLDKCVTKRLGSRLLARWLRQPLLDITDLRKRQNMVQVLAEDTSLREDMRDCLRTVPDLDALVRRFETQRAGLEEMYKLYIFVDALPKLHNVMAASCEQLKEQEQEQEEQDPSNLLSTTMQEQTERVAFLSDPGRLGKYQELIETLLDFDLAPREFRVQTTHDDTGELDRIAQELRDIEEKVETTQARILNKELAGFGAKFETDAKQLKTYGYHFRVPKKQDNMLKKVKGSNYITLAIVASGIKWTTTGLQSLNEQHTELSNQYSKAQAELVKQARGVCNTFMPLFEVAASVLGELDVLGSLAHCAGYAITPYCRPVVASPMTADMPQSGAAGQGIKLVAARHPCLELQEDVAFIPNDYDLERDSSRLQIVTGPNMGGKSTYIRQLGVIAVMAQIGSFVPCEEAHLPMLDAVLARVGASDAQLRGVSTFMAEMVEASAILQTATSNSLVIVDELGRGTSSYDGFGLAWAIAEHLAVVKKSFCLFATHFHELTALSQQVDGITNRHVTAMATDDDITFLYTVSDGPCDRSFGINIAKMAGFPESVVEVAKKKVAELEDMAAAVAVDGVGCNGSIRGNGIPEIAGSGGDETTEQQAKRARTEADGVDENKQQEFLEKFKALPAKELGPKELLTKARDLAVAMGLMVEP